MDKLSLKELKEFQQAVQSNLAEFSKQKSKQNSDETSRNNDDNFGLKQGQQALLARQQECRIEDLVERNCDFSCRYVELFWRQMKKKLNE